MLSPSEHELINALAEVLSEEKGGPSASTLRRAEEILKDPVQREEYLKWFDIRDTAALQY